MDWDARSAPFAAAPASPQLLRIMRLAGEYRLALLRLYEGLEIMASYAGPPEYLVARLVVAEIVGGTALPAQGSSRLGVFGPHGERVEVIPIIDRDGFRFTHVTSSDPAERDMVALVVFSCGAPSAVHLMPTARMPAIAEAFGARSKWGPSSLDVNLFSHCDFLLDPLCAHVMGVRSYDLSVLLETNEDLP